MGHSTDGDADWTWEKGDGGQSSTSAEPSGPSVLVEIEGVYRVTPIREFRTSTVFRVSMYLSSRALNPVSSWLESPPGDCFEIAKSRYPR